MHGWGFPRVRLSSETSTTADATSNTSNTTIVDTAASITIAVVAATTATLGGSNLAWRSDLNDRPGFQRRPRIRETLNFQAERTSAPRLPRKYFAEEVLVAVYETGHSSMPCYYKRLGYFHIAHG